MHDFWGKLNGKSFTKSCSIHCAKISKVTDPLKVKILRRRFELSVQKNNVKYLTKQGGDKICIYSMLNMYLPTQCFGKEDKRPLFKGTVA